MGKEKLKEVMERYDSYQRTLDSLYEFHFVETCSHKEVEELKKKVKQMDRIIAEFADVFLDLFKEI